MSRNFVKGGYVVVNTEKAVQIDTNEIIRKKLEELRNRQIVTSVYEEEDIEGFSEGLDPIEVSRLVDDDYDANQAEEESNGFEALELNKVSRDSGRVLGGSKEQIIKEARMEADSIIEEAQREAAGLREEARAEGFEEGKKKGYDEGMLEGRAQGEKEFAQKSQALDNDYNIRVQDLEREYNEKMTLMESMLVEKLTDIYQEVLGLNFADKNDTIIYILKKSLGSIDSSKNLIIHVSKDDFQNVADATEELAKTAGVSPDKLEILEDHSLEKNGCMIETDSGIFDTGLDTQLTLLKKQLRLLSLQA